MIEFNQAQAFKDTKLIPADFEIAFVLILNS